MTARGTWRSLAACAPVVVPIVVVNAGVQALLVSDEPAALVTGWFVVRLVASILSVIVAGWLTAVAADDAVHGRARTWPVRRPSTLIAVTLVVVAAVLAWLVTPFAVLVPLLAGVLLLPPIVAADPRPLRAVIRGFARSPVRGLALIAGALLLAPLSWVMALVLGFFVTGIAGAFLTWLWFGVVAAILLCAASSLSARSVVAPSGRPS